MFKKFKRIRQLKLKKKIIVQEAEEHYFSILTFQILPRLLPIKVLNALAQIQKALFCFGLATFVEICEWQIAALEES